VIDIDKWQHSACDSDTWHAVNARRRLRKSMALEVFNTVDELDLRRRDFRRDSYNILRES